MNGEQTLAVSKYDEVIQSLAFANELVKHIQLLEVDYSKAQKKQQKKDQAKETSDKYQRDMQRTKDVIIIQVNRKKSMGAALAECHVFRMCCKVLETNW